MSDHDRGAYTPHHDAPLSFDARKSRGRRAFPTTLLISLVILVGLGVAIFMFYRSGVRGAGEAPVPVGTPVGEIKSPPPTQAQQQEPGQGLQIYKSESGAPAAPGATTFAPPPEQPQARPAAPVAAQPIAPVTAQPAPVAAAPAPPPAPVAAAPAPAPKPAPAQVVTAAPVKPVPVQPAPKAAAPVVKTPQKDEVGALLDKADASKTASPKAAAPAKAEPVIAHGGAAIVQFGAFSSAELASSEWTKLHAAYPSEMSGKGKLVESVQRDGKTLFRGAVSGFTAKTDAVAFCAKLKADGRACIVK
ncbi:MAG: SPOR domain-containing protein [Caulobacteraceae bacterium]